MDQRPLYESLTRAGFQVLEFLDHPAAFGSWSVSVKSRHVEFRLVFDGRDKSLSLQQSKLGSGFLEIKSEKTSAQQSEMIALGISWLQECVRT